MAGAPPPLRVGVVGGGPCGLALAGALAREGGAAGGEGVEVCVFERGARKRDQGSGWDIDAPGRQALARAGLDVASVQREGSDTFRLFIAGTERPAYALHDPPLLRSLGLHGQADLETNRTAIIEGLLSGLEGRPGVTVRFDTAVRDVVPCVPPAGPGGRGGAAVLGGSNGQSVLGEFDIVVDASGVMSPLRRRRFARGAAAQYTGVSWIQGVVDCPEASLAPEVVRRLGEGTYMMVGPTKDGAGSLLSGLQRFGAEAGDRRATFMVHPRTVDTRDSHALAEALGLSREARGLVCDKAALRRVRKVLAEELSHPGWPAEYRACAEAISGFRVLPIFMHPAASETEVLPEDGLPLLCIGDALHALPPWSGTSGNFALRDASDAATELLELARTGAHRGGPTGPGGAVVAKLRQLEADFLARADGVGEWDPVRERCLKVARCMTEVWHRTPLEEFEFADFVTGGKFADPWASTCIRWTLKFLTWLNSWDNFRMAPAPAEAP